MTSQKYSQSLRDAQYHLQIQHSFQQQRDDEAALVDGVCVWERMSDVDVQKHFHEKSSAMSCEIQSAGLHLRMHDVDHFHVHPSSRSVRVCWSGYWVVQSCDPKRKALMTLRKMRADSVDVEPPRLN